MKVLKINYPAKKPEYIVVSNATSLTVKEESGLFLTTKTHIAIYTQNKLSGHHSLTPEPYRIFFDSEKKAQDTLEKIIQHFVINDQNYLEINSL